MAILSNINDLFRVDSAGAIYFATSAGADLQVLQSVGTGGSPIWVDVDDIIGGPYLPLTGGILTGNLALTDATNNPSLVISTGGLTVGGVTTLSSTSTSTLTINGRATFPSAVANRPQLPGGFLGLNTGDGNFDIWGISTQYYPSHATAGSAWGLQWNGDTNQFRFVGGGQDVVTIDLDQGNFVTTGSITGTTATFSGLVSGITPTANANFATKAYVDGIGGGVSKIIASTNITISPVTGLGDVTISATDTNTTYSAGNGITFTGTPATTINANINYISYDGSNNFIESASNLLGSSIGTQAKICYVAPGNLKIVSFGDVGDLPFTNNTGDLTSITLGNGLTGTSLSGPIPNVLMSGSYTGKFTIDSTGDVEYLALNTTATTNKRVRIQFTQNDNAGMEIGTDYSVNNGNDFYFYDRVAGSIMLFTSVASSFFSGKLAVGMTSTPNAQLHVSANGSAAHPNSTGIDVAAGAGGGNLLALDNLDNHNWLPYTDGHNYYSANNHYFRSGTGNSPYYMTINTSGNVGIGLGSGFASQKLQVQGSNHFVTFENTSTTANHYTQMLLKAGSAQNYIWTANQNSTNWGGANSLNIYTQQAGAIAFFTTAIKRMSILAGGNVNIQNKPNSGLAYDILINVGTSPDGVIGYQTQDQLASLLAVNANSNWIKTGTHIHNSNTGNVGVGTGSTAPSNRLTVNQGGGVRVTGIANGSYIELSGNLPGYAVDQYPVIKSDGSIHFANNGKYSAYIEGSDTYFGMLNSSQTTQVRLHTNGNTYFLGGSIGIGTTTPIVTAWGSTDTRQLTIVGSNYGVLNLQGSATALTKYSLGVGGTKFYMAYDNVAGIHRMTIDSTGNVGIGTTTPNRPLTIQSNSGATAISIYARNQDDYGFIQFFGYNQTTLWSEIAGRPSNISFYQNTNEVLRLGVASSFFPVGNIGIGVTSPGVKLEVEGSTNAIIKMNSTAGTGGRMDFAHSSANYGNVGSGRNILGTGNASDMMINADSLLILGVGSQDMTILPSGNVGIGVTNPGVPLDVSGKVRIRNVGQLAETVAQLNISSSGAGSTETRAIDIVGAWSGGENKSITYSYGGGGILGQTNFIYNGPGAQYRWGKLYYSGASSTYTMFLTATSTTTADLTVSGNITASADVVAYSDKRLKSNIKTLDGSKVLKMRGVSFDKDGKKGSGVIAQELEKVAPELVNNDNEYKGVAYGNLVGYLIEAIKELEARVKELENK